MWARHNRWAENNFKTQWFEQSPAVQHLTHTMYMDDSWLPQGCYKWLNFNYTHTISSATGSASWLVTVDTHTTSALGQLLNWGIGLTKYGLVHTCTYMCSFHTTWSDTPKFSHVTELMSQCHLSHPCLGRSTPREAESAAAGWWWWPQLTTSLCSQGFSLFLLQAGRRLACPNLNTPVIHHGMDQHMDRQYSDQLEGCIYIPSRKSASLNC